MSDFYAKIAAPIPGGDPFGEDVNYDLDYERLKGEMGKLGDMEDAVKIKNMMPVVGVVLPLAVMIAIGIGCSSKGSAPPTVSMTDSTVTINGMTWTRQNLNIETPDSRCYGDAPDSCEKYGRLYTYEAAKIACQSMGGAWRLPTREDWGNLMKALGRVKKVDKKDLVFYKNTGKKLKSKNGWDNNGNGTDDYGFSAMPGGIRVAVDFFSGVGFVGWWWSATESSGDQAYSLSMYSSLDDMGESGMYKSIGESVRCVCIAQD